MEKYHFDMRGASISNSEIAGTINHYHDTEIIQELRELRETVSGVSPELAESLNELRKAIEKKDKNSIASIARKISSGTAVSLLTKLASDSLKQLLGLG